LLTIEGGDTEFVTGVAADAHGDFSFTFFAIRPVI
jgi:hypothetical protein